MTAPHGRAGSIEAQAAKFRGVPESAAAAIIAIDDRGLIGCINPATERLCGYNATALISRNIKVLMPGPYNAEHDAFPSATVVGRARGPAAQCADNNLNAGFRKIVGIGREASGRKEGTTFPLRRKMKLPPARKYPRSIRSWSRMFSASSLARTTCSTSDSYCLHAGAIIGFRVVAWSMVADISVLSIRNSS